MEAQNADKSIKRVRTRSAESMIEIDQTVRLKFKSKGFVSTNQLFPSFSAQDNNSEFNEEFANFLGLSSDQFKNLKSSCFDTNIQLKSGVDLLKEQKAKDNKNKPININPKFDSLFSFSSVHESKGFPLNFITELTGHKSSGKTLLCLQLCKKVVEKNLAQNDSELKVYYMDCEGSLITVINKFTNEDKSNLKFMNYQRLFELTQVLLTLTKIENQIETQHKQIDLVVIDGLTYLEMNYLQSDKSTVILQIIDKIKKLNSEFKLTVVFTTKTSTDKRIKINRWSKLPHHRLKLIVDAENLRYIQLLQSNLYESKIVAQKIKQFGFVDGEHTLKISKIKEEYEELGLERERGSLEIEVNSSPVVQEFHPTPTLPSQ